MYLSGIYPTIEDYTLRCQKCLKRNRLTKELLQPHDILEGLWRNEGIKYLNVKGKQYILKSNYFSKFPFLFQYKTSW